MLKFKEDEFGNIIDNRGNRLCRQCLGVLEPGDDLLCVICLMRG